MTKHILLIEDSKQLVEAASKKFEMHGCHVYRALTVEAAKEAFLSVDHIDAIWLDHYLIGEESGLDFLKWMRKAEEVKHLHHAPVFLISNTISPDKIHHYEALGIENYYQKAINPIARIVKDMLAAVET